MPRVLRTHSARAEIRRIADHIAVDNPSAASRWLEQLDKLFKLLSEHPDIGQVRHTRRYGEVRRRTFGKYIIYYRSLTDGVAILHVFHGDRDQDRLI
jgi:toxin ParE1/3/4